ncbi:MAG: DUF1778 domain-containing protein [Microcystaceae cyanobacterium]
MSQLDIVNLKEKPANPIFDPPYHSIDFEDVDRVINLSEKDAETVFRLIENPPAPNEKLKVAAKGHREFFSETH